MDEAEGALYKRIGQLVVELLNLRRQHEAFVDDGATRKRGHIKGGFFLDVGRQDFILRLAADSIKQALEGIFVQSGRPDWTKMPSSACFIESAARRRMKSWRPTSRKKPPFMCPRFRVAPSSTKASCWRRKLRSSTTSWPILL